MNDTGTKVVANAALVCDGEELASSATQQLPTTQSTLTMTFSSAVSVEPNKKYQIKFVLDNTAASDKLVLFSSSITISATAVTYTEGTITSAPFALEGDEAISWVQYSELGTPTMEILIGDTWSAMDLTAETDSETPEGTTCKERTFRTVLPESTDQVQLRVHVDSASNCFVYGYGVIML